jgi:AraC-like DNA-binding protein
LAKNFFGNLRVTSLDRGPLDATLDAYDVGPLRIVQIDAPAHQVERDRQCGDLPSDDFYKLVLQMRGHGLIRQHDKSFKLNPGDWRLYDPQIPYSVINTERTSLLVVQVPRLKLKGFTIPKLHTFIPRSSGAIGLHSVFASFLHSLSEQLPALPNTSGQALSDSILGLLASSLAEYQEVQNGQLALPAVLKQRVMQYLQTHLGEADLNIERVAHAMNCSKRYLHLIFEDEECSLERYIWIKRLERCEKALRISTDQPRSISEIAFSCGFGSSAHFCKMFKAQFGIPPSEYRMNLTSIQNGKPVCV